MAQRSEFVDFVAEQMAFVSGLRIRAMLGGYSIYQDDCMFALIADDRLYFTADATTRTEFEAKGLGPFTYVARGKSMTMQYFEAPPDVFEEQDAMRAWVRKAVETALKATVAGTRAQKIKGSGADKSGGFTQPFVLVDPDFLTVYVTASGG